MALSRHGVNEVKLRNGRIVREGLHTSLTELRLRKNSPSARKRWASICSCPSVFVIGRDRAKLGFFWRHAYQIARSGRYQGSLVNPDSGEPVFLGEDGERLLAMDFKKAKLSEVLGRGEGANHARRPLYSPLWQADGTKTRRFAPIEFIGRHMAGFFDYAIGDEVHELKGGDTAQGNALGTLANCAGRIAVLTGTLLGGYASDLFNILFRLGPSRMLEEGFEHGEAGVRAFTETYGLLEKITVIEPADNACSDARVTTRVRHRPGASPLLFGRHLMSLGAFVSLEDISNALPPYHEDVVAVEMDQPLKEAYEELERDIKEAMREHRGNQSIISVALNALLAYPDRPYGFGDLMGREFNPETGRRESFLISATRDLNRETHLRQGTATVGRNSSFAQPRKKCTGVCSLHAEARCDPPAGKHPGERRDPGSSAHDPGGAGGTRSLVRAPVALRRPGGRGTSSPHADWARFMGFS